MRRAAIVLWLAACGLSTSCEVAGAQDRAAADPFVAIDDADPMELARAVDREGDDAVLERLDASRPRSVRLAAARAAPWMRAPELALEPLAVIASGRDPQLAPAAAQAALAIVNASSADQLAQREVDLASLSAARRELAGLAEDASARADLRVAAATARDRLDQLGVR